MASVGLDELGLWLCLWGGVPTNAGRPMPSPGTQLWSVVVMAEFPLCYTLTDGL